MSHTQTNVRTYEKSVEFLWGSLEPSGSPEIWTQGIPHSTWVSFDIRLTTLWE